MRESEEKRREGKGYFRMGIYQHFLFSFSHGTKYIEKVPFLSLNSNFKRKNPNIFVEYCMFLFVPF